jgi:PIN domain nuclease of toxin-antitoxin system
MKRLLVDTQLLVWLADRSEQLPLSANAVLQDPAQQLVFSLVSIWETAIKYALGRPDFTMHPQQLQTGLLAYGFTQLPISSNHVIAVARLPPVHRDPFDRLLVAQAEVEGLTLMTTDKQLTQYGPHVKRFK